MASRIRRRKAKGEKTLRPVHPNAGIEAAFRKRLVCLIEEMHASYLWFLRAAYRKDPPKMAEDIAARTFARALSKLFNRWYHRFSETADNLADYFAQAVHKRSDAALKKILKDGGFAIEFHMTRAQQDILAASVEESVALIKSIPERYHASVTPLVMQSVRQGGDLEALTRELHKQFGVTKRRAALIARDQNRKATAALQRARQEEIGIEECIWVHSGGGREPRPTHLKAGRDKQRYDPAVGWLDPAENKRIWPGQLINCFPGDMPVSLDNGCLRLWRSPFDGPMVYVEVGSDLLKATSNHPILTARGWIAISDLHDSDQVVCMALQGGDIINDNVNERIATFDELFESGTRQFGYVRREGRCFDFYGETPKSHVDEIIVGDDRLLFNRQVGIKQDCRDFSFTKTNSRIKGAVDSGSFHISHSYGASFGDDFSAFFGGRFSEAPEIGGTGVAGLNPVALQSHSDISCCMTRSAENFRNSGGPESFAIKLDDARSQGDPVKALVDLQPKGPELFAEFVRVAADLGRSSFEIGARAYEFRRAKNKRIIDFSGHVYTLETHNGYYSVSGAYAQVKNCRCVSRPVVKGFE